MAPPSLPTVALIHPTQIAKPFHRRVGCTRRRTTAGGWWATRTGRWSGSWAGTQNSSYNT